MAALFRLSGISARLLRDDHMPSLHTTREGYGLLGLLKGKTRKVKRQRVIVKAGALGRWFRRRYRCSVDEAIEHPHRASLAQFIRECDNEAPGADRAVSELIESLYEFGAGGKSAINETANSPLSLLTAHRAKGLEFDHVIILDGNGWSEGGDDERRLYYVAMTRARKTLTLCKRSAGAHRFVEDVAALCLRTRPASLEPDERLTNRTWVADPEQVVLSWPGYFSPRLPIHKSIGNLDVGDPLFLRPRHDGKPGWELLDTREVVVTRMAQKFRPPEGRLLEIRVAAILSRDKRAGDSDELRCSNWEIVIPEIEYTV